MSITGDQTDWPGLRTIAAREAAILAPYAMYSADSRGRKHSEPEHPYRGPFQRDRDRIVHSAAYRRLSDKTQVFTGEEMGDYHRNRLTHTLEVAFIARTLGRALRLNEDLIEALALLHDIGHPPFGHAGEDALSECLAAEGGFCHNQYALCLIEELETHYRQFPGLNLTREVIEGQTARTRKQQDDLQCLLEVQVVDVADSITYDAHDTDDAVELGLVTLEELHEIPLIRQSAQRVGERFDERFGELAGPMLRKAVVHELIDRQVSDVLRHSGALLAKNGLASAEAARRANLKIGSSSELSGQKTQLEAFLQQRVYRHPDVMRERREAQGRLKQMFGLYAGRPDLLPDKFRDRARQVGLRRSVGDYLAGMTDQYCRRQYRRHIDGTDGGVRRSGAW